MRERRRDGDRNGSDENETDKEAQPEKPLDELDAGLESFVQEHAPPLGKGEAELTLAAANQDAKKIDERQAEDRYGVGERIGGFLCRKGHRALGYKRAGPCLRQRFDLGRSWAYESARFAKVATREEIKGMTWEVAKAGLKLLTLLELGTFKELSKKPLPILAPDGEPVYFPATPEQLAAAIALLEKKPATPNEPEDPEAAKQGERSAFNAATKILNRHLEQTPELEELKPSVYIFNGEATFKIGKVGLRSPLFDAYIALVTEIRKAIKR